MNATLTRPAIGQYKTDEKLLEYKVLCKKYGERNLSSAIIYTGLSPYNGMEIYAQISGMIALSQNKKTGSSAQLTILVNKMHPNEALKTGADVAICGQCPLRGHYSETLGKMVDRLCYVQVNKSPSSKHRAKEKGTTITLTPHEAGVILYANGKRTVRLGEYGDPAMIPVEIYDELFMASEGKWLGYTHQWKESFFDSAIFNYTMASLDNDMTREELEQAHGDTARSYRVTESYDDIRPNEIACPSKDKVSGIIVLQCNDCNLCAGAGLNAKNIVIVKNT